ncbi:MAG: MarR family transcriptional regulator, partial [Thermomicrobiales bacterium]
YDYLRELAIEHPSFATTDSDLAFLDVMEFAGTVTLLELRYFEFKRLSANAFGILAILGKDENTIRRPSDLANILGVTRTTTTGLLDTLERQGYVTRTLDNEDRRCIMVRGTLAGREALQRMSGEYFAAISTLMLELNPAEQMLFRKLSRKLPATIVPSEGIPLNFQSTLQRKEIAVGASATTEAVVA